MIIVRNVGFRDGLGHDAGEFRVHGQLGLLYDGGANAIHFFFDVFAE
jgi:hypothetical protein